MNKCRSLSNKFIVKLGVLFLITVLSIGIIYVYVTFFLLDNFYSQTTQKLNANLADHLIEEKFKNTSPFLDNGTVNVELFDDIMHDMMAVNRAIEVYLLDKKGEVLHSLVLDHDDKSKATKKIDLVPVKQFIANKEVFILGDDPKDIKSKKIFSAAAFESKGQKGFIYILLASESFELVCENLFKGYFSKLMFIALLITMLLAIVIGGLSIVFISKNLLIIMHYVNRFKEGDLNSRIPNASKSNLSILATTFNEMADTISFNMNEIYSINTFKKELIATVSHDLRTPLTIIRGYAETLKDGDDKITNQNRKEFLKIIENSTSSISSLVNHLSDYSNLDAKQIKLKPSIFNITELVLDITKRYNIIKEEKKIKILIYHNKDDSQLVYADKSLIERVIQNILDNSFKFTPSDGIISFHIEKRKNGLTIIKIKDTGPGIRKQDRKLIFKKYARTTSAREVQGIGLGLAIVKKIMELHNSDVKIYNNDKNRGCSFEFSLPSDK